MSGNDFEASGMAADIDRENSARAGGRYLRSVKCGCGKSLLLRVQLFETSFVEGVLHCTHSEVKPG